MVQMGRSVKSHARMGGSREAAAGRRQGSRAAPACLLALKSRRHHAGAKNGLTQSRNPRRFLTASCARPAASSAAAPLPLPAWARGARPRKWPPPQPAAPPAFLRGGEGEGGKVGRPAMPWTQHPAAPAGGAAAAATFLHFSPLPTQPHRHRRPRRPARPPRQQLQRASSTGAVCQCNSSAQQARLWQSPPLPARPAPLHSLSFSRA